MDDNIYALLDLVSAGFLLWLRAKHVQRQWLRVILLILAVLLVYPAVNMVYVGVKQFVSGS